MIAGPLTVDFQMPKPDGLCLKEEYDDVDDVDEEEEETPNADNGIILLLVSRISSQ